MTDLSAGNAAFYWATLFFRRLRQHRVRHAVISPGSRSTPLTLAVSADDHFQKHVILDERSAAFTALGIGKSTNIPALLICTSGTAVANYYPAVIEARKSGVPLLMATADRPPHLRDTGANQTADQLKIFGDYPVFFHETGEPVIKDDDLNRLRMAADQAVTASLRQRGPAHLNFPFRKPLEPDPEFLRQVTEENRKRSGESGSGTEVEYLHTGERLTLSPKVGEILSKAKKPLLIAGPTAPGDHTGSAAGLAKQLQCPVISESTINSDGMITGYDLFLRDRNVRRRLSPDLVLRFGYQPVSNGIETALKEWEPDHHIHFASNADWHDATCSSTLRIPWMGREIISGDIPAATEEGWMEQWKKTDQRSRDRVEKVFEETETLTDGHIYRHFTPRITGEHFIAVSNSFPARDIYLFGRFDRHIPLFLNRGASGIDGITSSAIGISLGTDRPGVLFTGDLAFLHDSNALLSHKLLNRSLVVIVINNSGGSIFRTLPVRQYERYFRTYFETPQSVDIGKLTGSYGISFYRADTVENLHEIDLHTLLKGQNGLTVIECKTDADASMRLRNQLWNGEQG